MLTSNLIQPSIPNLLPMQKRLKTGDLRCIYTNFVFGQAVVDAYNCFTDDFNAAYTVDEQNALLNQRNAFLEGVMKGSLDKAKLNMGVH